MLLKGQELAVITTTVRLKKEDFFSSKSISYADFALAIGNAVMEEWQGVYLIAEKE